MIETDKPAAIVQRGVPWENRDGGLANPAERNRLDRRAQAEFSAPIGRRWSSDAIR